MTLGLVTVLVAAAGIFLGAVLQRVSGTGVGLVVGPILALAMGPSLGVFVTNIVTIASAFTLMVMQWRDIDWPRVKWLVAAAIPGSVFGAWLVRELPSAWLQLVLGCTVLFALAITFAFGPETRRDGPGHLVTAGTVAGALNTTVGVSAPSLVIYSRLARWPHRHFGASMQPVFFALGVEAIVLKASFGSIGDEGALPAWWYLPIVLAVVLFGVWVGTRMARRITADAAQRVAIALAGLGGAVVLTQGVVTLVSGG